MSDLSTAASRFSEISGSLLRSWALLGESWRDQSARHFQQEYLDESLQKLQGITERLGNAHMICSDARQELSGE